MKKTTTVKCFSTTEILATGTGYAICAFTKVHELVEHVCGFPVWTHQLIRLLPLVGEELVRQVGPWAGDKANVAALAARLKALDDPKQRAALIADFVAQVETDRLGLIGVAGVAVYHPIESRPGSFERRDPLKELREIAPDKPVIVIELTEGDPA